MEPRPLPAREQVRPRAAGEPADQREACDHEQKGGGVEGHVFLLTCPPIPFALSLSKGRSCLQPKRKEGRCFDKLSTNGEGESNVENDGGRIARPPPTTSGTEVTQDRPHPKPQ